MTYPNPVLSIVVPFYSTPENDRRAMLNQLMASIPDRPDLEVIIVDDRSDPPCEPLAKKKKASVRLSLTPRDSKYAGAARNHGLSLARGDFILCADSDDLFETSGLNEFIDALAKSGTGETVKIHIAQAKKFDGARTSNPLYERLTTPKALLDPARVLAKWHAPWGKAFPRSLLDAGLSFREDCIVDDTPFSVRLAVLADEVVFHKFPIYLVRRNHEAGALTAQTDPDSIRARIQAYRDANDALLAAGLDDLVTPMLIPCYEFARKNPRIAFSELAKSLVSRERIIPRKLRLPVRSSFV